MNPGEVATTKFLLSEFMKSEDWNRIDEALKYSSPVRYDDIIKARDKFLGEEHFLEAAKNYPDKTAEEIRNLAGFLTITEESREVFLPGCRGAWHITDFSKINGDDYFLMYNDNSRTKEVIVDRSGNILMDRRCNFEDLKDRLDKEARKNGSPEKSADDKKSKSKSKEKEER